MLAAYTSIFETKGKRRKIIYSKFVYIIYIIYICSELKAKVAKETAVLPNRRKVIDLKGDTFRSLSLMAANKGTNLKRLIEGLLDNVAEDYDDSKAYAWLVENRPDGQVFLNENEKKDFENWLGV